MTDDYNDYDAFDDFNDANASSPPPAALRSTQGGTPKPETDIEYRRPTVEELREWVQARPRAGKLLWRKSVTRHKTSRRSKSERSKDVRSQFKLYGALIEPVAVREPTGEIAVYRAGTSAVLIDDFGRPSVVIPGFTRVLASHAMFALVHGEYPKRLLHKNGNKQDISIHNLVVDTQAARDERSVRASGIKSASKTSIRRTLKDTALGQAAIGKTDAVEAAARDVLEKLIDAMSAEVTTAVPGERATSTIQRAFNVRRVEDARSAVEQQITDAGNRAMELGKALRRAARRNAP